MRFVPKKGVDAASFASACGVCVFNNVYYKVINPDSEASNIVSKKNLSRTARGRFDGSG